METSVATSVETGLVEILPPGESWGGATRGEWTGRAYQRGLSLPLDVSPMLDPTGERCGYGQSGPAFFWVGGERADEVPCVVAEGIAIYVNVSGGPVLDDRAAAVFRANRGRTASVRQCTGRRACYGAPELRVNGVDVDLEGYRTTAPMFTITYPKNNISGWSRAWPRRCPTATASSSPHRRRGTMGYCALSAAYFGERLTRMVTVIVEAPEVIESPPTISRQTRHDCR